ncbi:Calcium-transporting ATPase lmo0841 [uncultured Blautia sp.]|nr:Calcium-transporting ATPase lmo0841 [uncultured Blautia sp.]
MKAYYNETVETVRRDLNGEQDFLTNEEVKRRQEKFGFNELAEGKKKSGLQIFLEQYKDFLVLILIVSAVVSLFLGETESAAVILVVITMNAILGTVQTIKAENSLESLKQLAAPEVKVVRNGAVVRIPGREITVGDVVHLEAGDYIPADGRVLESASLKVDESALTGESIGVDKISAPLTGELPLGDRRNMVFSGSYVTYGRGVFLVTGIGMNTEIGKIAGLLKNTSEKKTPLQINLDRFGKKLSMIILLLCAVLFTLQVLKGGAVADAFLFAVALAVAAIPEALSSIVTIVLAFGTRKMAKEGAIIRKLQSVEGLGSISVICSDKTGTLTQNRMTIEHYYVDGQDIPADQIDPANPLQEQMLKFSILCNDSTNVEGQEIGDPTETAMINLGDKVGISAQKVRDACPRSSEVPFDSDRKLMSTFHKMKDGYTMITKGAVDVMLKRVDYIQKGGKILSVTEEDVENICRVNEQYSESGLRVLGIGYRHFPVEKNISTEDEKGLIFLGLLAMMDPPRTESAAAVSECKRAGICPVMITGDHKVTAAAIAKRIGILDDISQACEGAQIDGMSDEDLQGFVENIRVYARVTPEHKIRIVRAWQERGNIVAMTGDGVNDAPALKQADVGVAMGITGTEVAKDAASMVLTDDNFATIIKAVESGRNIYENIKKAIQFLLAGNFAAILVVIVASLMSLPVPFAPVHLLFINLLTDSLPAIALGLEPCNHDVMGEKPRPVKESILTKDFLIRIGVEGGVIGAVVLAAFLIGYRDGNKVLAGTMAFAVLCLSRLLHGYNCKAKKPVIFTGEFFNNRFMQGAFLAGFVLLTVVLMVPVLHGFFAVQTLKMGELLTVYGLSGLSMLVIQGMKQVVKF